MCHPSWARARAEAQRLSDLARLRRVRDRIDREYARPLDVVALARGVGMAAGQLGREFRLAYGDSPYGYLTARRIERAAAFLRCGALGVAEARLAVGCPSPAAFDARFTELVGMPPAEYRRLVRRAVGPVRIREAPATEPQLA
ncbi:helix-turn-helix transcriptional regulator [Kitasatospora sp. NPDC087861]|uniref:helix-turn-helix transcriptional regulator n=1 Tax=Kitasatospora sp. NPDC087861 TaxID=3364070 RepID=UPI00381B8ACF